MNNLDLETQLEMVREDGLAIRHIENPSEEVQLEAVRENGCAIYFIDNPSEVVKLEAAKSYIEDFVDMRDTIKQIIMDNLNETLNIQHRK